jgi:hypothetical protein
VQSESTITFRDAQGGAAERPLAAAQARIEGMAKGFSEAVLR